MTHRFFKLLEEHLEQLRAEEGTEGDALAEEDDETGWEGWDAQSDSSESSSASWIDVESDNQDIYVSDSDEDVTAKKKKGVDEVAQPEQDQTMSEPTEPQISSLATTKARFRSYLDDHGPLLTKP